MGAGTLFHPRFAHPAFHSRSSRAPTLWVPWTNVADTWQSLPSGNNRRTPYGRIFRILFPRIGTRSYSRNTRNHTWNPADPDAPFLRATPRYFSLSRSDRRTF